MANYKPSQGSGIGPEDKIHDSIYNSANCQSSGSIDTFGSWVECSADIGTGKVLQGVILSIESGLVQTTEAELEIGEGASASEVAKERIQIIGNATNHSLFIPLNRVLTANARISVRTRDSLASAKTLGVVLFVS